MKKTHELFSFAPIRTHESFKRWYSFSCFSLVLTILVLILLSMYDYWKILLLDQSYKIGQQKLSTVNAAEQQIELLNKTYMEKSAQLEKLQNHHVSCVLLTEILEYLSQNIPPDVALEEVHYHPDKGFTCQGNAYSIASMEIFVNALSNHKQCSNISIETISESNQMNEKKLIHFKLIVTF